MRSVITAVNKAAVDVPIQLSSIDRGVAPNALYAADIGAALKDRGNTAGPQAMREERCPRAGLASWFTSTFRYGVKSANGSDGKLAVSV
jgi:hypothetical protein